jgi:uncharacterized membrane protein SpoIIM required for sporulation
LLAFALFTVPGVAGYAYLRAHPAMAEQVVPEGMLERAEAAEAREAKGQGYVQFDADQRPMIASQIIVNNVRVSLRMFLGGIFFGLGSLLMLAFNGLSIGTISGYYANTGHMGYLWTFIVGHGVLELFALWVAGAAGFRLGLAVIAPGNLSRSDALALTGRSAMRMLAAVILFLLIAGSIEGLISASGSSLRTRLWVSGSSLVFLVTYLTSGALRQQRNSRTIGT